MLEKKIITDKYISCPQITLKILDNLMNKMVCIQERLFLKDKDYSTVSAEYRKQFSSCRLADYVCRCL